MNRQLHARTRVQDPFQFAVLPAMLDSGASDFMFRFAEHVDGAGSAAHCAIAFTLFRDPVAYNQCQAPAFLVDQFESVQIPDSPTHAVHLDLAPGQYLWVASVYERWPRIDGRGPIPGIFLNCGSLGVRRITRSL